MLSLKTARVRRILCKVLLASFAVIGGACSSTVLKADDTPITRVLKVIKLDPVGNAHIVHKLTSPTNVYIAIKNSTPSLGVMCREFGLGRQWWIYENMDARLDDLKNTIEMDYTQIGFARITHGNEWSMVLGVGAQPLEIHDTTALFDYGELRDGRALRKRVGHIVCPDGSKNLEWHAATGTFTYVYEPKVPAGGQPNVAFQLENKDHYMSCLSKLCSNRRRTWLWTARTRFDNRGSTILSDYAVRFRIADFGSWSPWSHTSKVYPGQSVVDPYFPVLEIEKLCKLTESRPATLEVEYEYKRPDGQLVTENESRNLRILGMNEVVFSELPPSERLNFADQVENLRPALAVFTTPGDPVIQQLAGRVCGREFSAASYTNDDAFKYMRNLYSVLSENHVAYQSPPGFSLGSNFVQHIKYGRDVLRNHAGTCVDLAILWASACEAVGLQPTLITIPGHCFVMIKLPNGLVTAVETTCIGRMSFNKAVEIGLKEYAAAKAGPAMWIDVAASRKDGIQSVDLPSVGPDYLGSLGYNFEVQTAQQN